MAFPTSPSNDDLHTEFGRTFKYSSASNSWSVATPDAPEDNALTTQGYVDVQSLPLTDVAAGSKAFVQDGNKLFIFTGSGWFEIATINTAPTITSGADATYALNSDGTPTVITLQATDPEGTPIVWGYQVTSGSLEDTTVTNVGGVFTITPGSIEATFNLTFTASDGVNIDTVTSTFDLSLTPRGQAAFTTAGTYSWTAPDGVTSVCAVCVGGGGGATYGGRAGSGSGGGGLGWRNNITVTPGETYTVVVGAGGLRASGTGGDGGASYFINATTVAGFGGIGGQGGAVTAAFPGGAGGSWVGDGGGNGGAGGADIGISSGGGGGGAGGYAGNGGDGGMRISHGPNGAAGQGGGGGGGGGCGEDDTAGSGGGVGIYGQGASGAGGTSTLADGYGGFGGSGGTDASMAARLGSIVSKAPPLISASMARRLTDCLLTRRQKSNRF